MEHFHDLMSNVDDLLEKLKLEYPVLKRISETMESKLGVSTRCAALSILMFPIAWFMKLEMLKLCLLFFCMFRSVTAIEKGQGDRTRWLMFWLIFYTFEIVCSSPIGWAAFQVIPKGYITYTKLGVYIWCASPKHSGCQAVYQLFRPAFLGLVGIMDKNRAVVSDHINMVVDVFENIDNQAMNAVAAAVVRNEMSRFSEAMTPAVPVVVDRSTEGFSDGTSSSESIQYPD